MVLSFAMNKWFAMTTHFTVPVKQLTDIQAPMILSIPLPHFNAAVLTYGMQLVPVIVVSI